MVAELGIAEQGGDSELPSREDVSAIGFPGILVEPWEVPWRTVILRHREPRSMFSRSQLARTEGYLSAPAGDKGRAVCKKLEPEAS